MNEDNEQSITVLAVSGGLWATAPVTEQPELTMSSWSVRQLPAGDRLIVGWCRENHEGRVSSAILEFDPQTRRGRTQSGRVYELSGRPGSNRDAEFVWQHWLRIHGESDWTDVTAEVVKP